MRRLLTLALLPGCLYITDAENEARWDLDGDGVSRPQDCDDDDATLSVSTDETCDNLDNDCDGKVDEGIEVEEVCDGEDQDCDGNVDEGIEVEEICDDEDQDCDGNVDEGLNFKTWYVDNDGDGFVGTAVETCEKPDGAKPFTEDCDDTDAGVNPEAEEECGNTVDEDCDGTLLENCGCPVYVAEGAVNGDGTEEKPFATINTAIAALPDDCDVIYVGPGDYPESFAMERPFQIYGTDGSDYTTVAGSTGPVIEVSSLSGAGAVISGFTLTGGTGRAGSGGTLASDREYGGCLYIEDAQVDLSDLAFESCTAEDSGGGAVFGGWSGRADDLHFEACEAGDGAAFFMTDSDGVIDGCRATGNSGTHAIEVASGDPTIANCLVDNNSDSGVELRSNDGTEFINNTVVDNPESCLVVTRSGNILINNILSSCKVAADIQTENIQTWDTNCLWDYEDAFDGQDEFSGVNTTVYSDPGFANPGQQRYHLKATSAVRNSGVDTSAFGIVDDIEGTARPQGSAYSCGAYER